MFGKRNGQITMNRIEDIYIFISDAVLRKL